MIHLPQLRQRALLPLAAATVLGVALIPSPAKAAYVDCLGVAKKADKHDLKQLAYTLRCNSDVKGYSIVASNPLDTFSTETVVTDQSGAVQGKEQFGCEGPIPSNGFGCNGTMAAGHTVTGDITASDLPCADPKRPLKLWFVVYANDLQTDGSYAMKQSQPFAISTPKCKKPKRAKKGKKHGAKH